MRKLLSLVLALAMLVSLASCGGGTAPSTSAAAQPGTAPASTAPGTTQPPAQPKREQVINSIYSGEVTTINYLMTASTNEFELACNLVDSLIDYDRYGIIRPALAESWSVSDDKLVWTFKIREGVQWVNFHGEPVAEVVADDWVAAMEYILDPENASQTAQIAYSVIKNAEKFYNKEIEDFAEVGVKAVDKYTLEYTLEHPVPYFESMLNYVTFFPVNREFLKESGVRFGTHNSTLLYNGSFILEVFEPQSRRVLVKNEHYWDKDQIFIEKINERYNKEASAVAQELYLRGEISGLSISSAMLDEWMNDPEKLAMMRPGRPSFYTFFFAFNFKPEFAEENDPANWKLAVNNLNFRKSIFHGLNRLAAMMTHEPYNPQNRILNTITPKNFVAVAGHDYVTLEPLKKFTETDSFNPELAAEYKVKAMAELKDQVSFPVKVVLNYNSGSSANADRAQVIEQQLENLLGTEYVDVIILPYPPTGYLNATRRSGNYAFQEVNWGPDYADPQTYTDPFKRGGNYNFPEYTTEVDENGRNKFEVYEELVQKAMAIVTDNKERYELFAQAEGYMIENAWVIPFATGGGGYISSSLNPFESPYSPFGVAGLRYKGQKMMDKPMDTETFYKLQEEWEKEREEALQKANQ